MNKKELLEKRAKLIADARALIDKADVEKRNLSAEERIGWDKMLADADQCKKDLDAILALEQREKEQADYATSQGRKSELEMANKGTTETTKKIELRKSVCNDERIVEVPNEAGYRKVFNRYLMNGDKDIEARAILEKRALQKDSSTAGGYLSAPMEFMAELIQEIDNEVFMRQIARVLPPMTTADSLGCPSLDADPADPTWVSELSIGSADSTMAFGKRELKPHNLAQYILVSKTLLRRSAISADTIVRNRLAYKVGVIEENVFLNGTGAGQPLGVFTASANGISTGRDVSTGNTNTAITFDGLQEAKYSLKAQYRGRNCRWIFHRTGVKQIAKLKDGEGRYIWQPSVIVGQPDMLLSYPVIESEYAPSTFTGGLYVGLLGDFSFYWIVDALTMEIQVLIELGAATNQNYYILRKETDGMPILENAFARVTLAS